MDFIVSYDRTYMTVHKEYSFFNLTPSLFMKIGVSIAPLHMEREVESSTLKVTMG